MVAEFPMATAALTDYRVAASRMTQAVEETIALAAARNAAEAVSISSARLVLADAIAECDRVMARLAGRPPETA